MSRLTEDTGHNYEPVVPIELCINKLGALENFEDKLGVELHTILLAVTNGIYKVQDNLIYFTLPDELCINFDEHIIDYSFNSKDEEIQYHFEDYGKTWSLVRTDLEKK